jgi:DNA repair exonuclease SbcCD ATPase subunit
MTHPTYLKEENAMKKSPLTILVILLLAAILAACGVAQADYDKVASDLTTAQNEINDLDSQLADAQEQISSLENELEAYQSEYDDLNDEYDRLLAEAQNVMRDYDDLDAQVVDFEYTVEQAGFYKDVVITLLLPAFSGDVLADQTTIDAVGLLVERTGDAELQGKYEAWAADASNRDLAVEILVDALLKMEGLIF